MITENKDLQERNEAIALFMGHTGLTKVKDNKIVPYNKSYETIWGNIMPVVEKIERDIVPIEILDMQCSIGNTIYSEKIFHSSDESKIEAVFLAVSDFCIKHNGINKAQIK